MNSSTARAQAREAAAKRDAKQAAIREQVRLQMAHEASAARSRALEELQANGGGAAGRRDDMLGSALKMLARELPPRPSAAPVPLPAPGPPAEPVLSAVETLSLQLLQEKATQNEAMADELAELAARRAARKQASQLAKERASSGLAATVLPEERAVAHASLFAWRPPPLGGEQAAE